MNSHAALCTRFCAPTRSSTTSLSFHFDCPLVETNRARGTRRTRKTKTQKQCSYHNRNPTLEKKNQNHFITPSNVIPFATSHIVPAFESLPNPSNSSMPSASIVPITSMVLLFCIQVVRFTFVASSSRSNFTPGGVVTPFEC